MQPYVLLTMATILLACCTASTLSEKSSKTDESGKETCGGGCIWSRQCATFSGTANCRCTWFSCTLYSSQADLTDSEQFEMFIKEYSDTVMLTSAEKAYRKLQQSGRTK